MRWLRRVALLVLAAVAVLLAASNDAPVELRLAPDGLPLGPLPTLTAPLFAVILAVLFIGLAFGKLLVTLVIFYSSDAACHRCCRRGLCGYASAS